MSSFKKPGASRLSILLIMLAFLSLGISAVFFHMNPGREITVMGRVFFPRTAGLFCITLAVFIYFVGRILGVLLSFKKPSA